MSNNPYARFVDGQDAAALVRAFPAKLEAVLAQIGPSGMGRRLAPGKWTVSEMLCHLADTEIAFGFRWRQALAEENHVVQPFDQDKWAPRYPTMAGEDALRTLLAMRHWNVLLLDRLAAEDWTRPVFHPERGEMDFRTMVEMMAGHDLNHLVQLETIAAQA
jgi:hypothetical protein